MIHKTIDDKMKRMILIRVRTCASREILKTISLNILKNDKLIIVCNFKQEIHKLDLQNNQITYPDVI